MVINHTYTCRGRPILEPGLNIGSNYRLSQSQCFGTHRRSKAFPVASRFYLYIYKKGLVLGGRAGSRSKLTSWRNLICGRQRVGLHWFV